MEARDVSADDDNLNAFSNELRQQIAEVGVEVHGLLALVWSSRGSVRPAVVTRSRRVSKTRRSRRAGRAYQELKGELGLDHIEGRSFPGWHHHVSVVRRGYAFIVAERVLRFSPSTGRQADDSTLPVAA